jgi:hypothetical protein
MKLIWRTLLSQKKSNEKDIHNGAIHNNTSFSDVVVSSAA